MFETVIKLIQVFVKELLKASATKLVNSRGSICHDLFRLYVALEDLSDAATTLYASFQRYLQDIETLGLSEDHKVTIRRNTRHLLQRSCEMDSSSSLQRNTM